MNPATWLPDFFRRTRRSAPKESESPAEHLKTLAIILGPYRNLTTLTAAALSLHPDVQVLNHAAERLWKTSDIDFFRRPEQSVYRRFLTAAVDASADGRRGLHGGSILHSHAFDDRSLRLLYQQRYGDRRIKAKPTCLVWKDSVAIQRRLSGDEDLLPHLIANLPGVRFVLPVRQPVDCAASNMATGLVSHLVDGRPAGIAEVIDAVLQAIVWVLIQRDRWPERFFVFSERVGSVDLARDLAGYLNLPHDAQWRRDFQAVYRVRRKQRHSPDVLRLEREKIAIALAPWPDLRDARLA
jgi:hypothetical protein